MTCGRSLAVLIILPLWKSGSPIVMQPIRNDGRSKLISISVSGKNARNDAVNSIEPILNELMKYMGAEKTKSIIPFLRDLRIILNNEQN